MEKKKLVGIEASEIRRKPTLRNTKKVRRQYIGLRSSVEQEQTVSTRKVVGSNPTGGATMHTVVVQEWDESERGWGTRPDGASLHLTQEDASTYVKDYWATMPDMVPDEYERPSGSTRLIDVNAEVYERVKKTKNGLRIWPDEYRTLKK